MRPSAVGFVFALCLSLFVLSSSAAALVAGDVDGSTHVDAVDVQLVINAVLPIDVGDARTDVNCDGAMSATDVQLTINKALGLYKASRYAVSRR